MAMRMLRTPPGPKARTEAERFWPKTDKHAPASERCPELRACWLWTAALNNRGYGRFGVGSTLDGTARGILAHVWAFLSDGGRLAPGLEIDHLCRVRRCVRPTHMEAVTHRENTLRGDAPSARHARKTHCPQGHEYAGTNLHLRPNGGRRCRICVNRQNKSRRKQTVQ